MNYAKTLTANERNKSGRVYKILFVAAFVLFLLFCGTQKTYAATNGFKVVGKVGYYYRNGKKVTGWQTINGKRYYFNSKGQQKLGWERDSNGNRKRFFFSKAGAEGYMATDFVIDGNKNVYYFNPSTGIVAKGWTAISGRYRYFNTTTGIAYMGLKKVDNYYYYFIRTYSNKKYLGARSTVGWATLNGKRYYFNPTNGRAQKGWLTYGGKKYYFSNGGVMYKSATITVGGVKYNVDANGVVTKASTSKYNVENKGSYGIAHDPNGRTYYVAKEFFTHEGVADGTASDRDILAAIIECEAGDQGLIGMEAVAMCILNRTIKSDKEFPSELRYVVYQVQYPSSYPQYSPIRYGASGSYTSTMDKRMKGKFDNKTLAYQAADAALSLLNNYVKNGTARTIKGFDRKDFNFMYFMTVDYFWKMSLTFNKVDYYWYKYFNKSSLDHMFFVDWV